MRFKLSKTARLLNIENSKSIISTGTKQFFANKEEREQIFAMLEFVKEEKNDKEIDKFLAKKAFDKKLWKKLIQSNMITQNENVFEKTNSLDFKNHLYLDVLYNKKAKKLIKNFKEYHFIIVGAGGIGNYMTFSLAFYSPKSLILIDKDKIELSNLNRQFLFDYEDIGRYKVEVLKDRLVKKGITIPINAIKEYANYNNIEKLLQTLDQEKCFMVVSADSKRILEELTKIAVKYKIPFLNIGYLNDISLIGPFYIPDFSSCLFCHNAFAIEENNTIQNELIEYINSQSNAPSTFINNALASSMASIDILHYLSGEYKKMNSLNKRIGLSNSDFKRLELINSKDENCKYCS